MKRLAGFTLLVIILVSGTVNGQKKPAFYLQPQITLLNGTQTVDGAIGFVSGAEWGPWQFGAGAEMDYYEKRSVPFYAEARRFFTNQKKRPFVYAGAGVNFAWPTRYQHYYYYDWWGSQFNTLSEFGHGRYLQGGIGVQMQSKKGKGFSISLGYSSKTMTEKWVEEVWDPSTSTRISTPRSIKYEFNRVDLKVGFRVF